MSHIKSTLKQAYNNYAEHRDRSEIEPWKAEEREKFLNLLKYEKRTSLLEIGAGPGRDSLYFQQQGLNVTAVDFSEEMIRLCLEKGLDAKVMDFSQLDFPPESFDSVYALNCLLHVPKSELDGVLQEIRRVLKMEGLFFLGMYGGKETEGIWEDDFYEPKRFFAMYKDETILEIVQRHFILVDFHTVDMGAGAPHFQSILLRKS
jgi:ubiquinone/menaquinone biosynthesis C-methylase UbiE